ncbi:MAG: GAF domain-containing protein [Chloroflexi bacterium]|nr:GAF domain-containing protein [Chloroflexota bacterium]
MDFLSKINAAHILVAESNPDAMSFTAGILEDAGYNVQKAYYAGDALFAMEHGHLDLVLIDVGMRDRNIPSLVEAIASNPRFATIRWLALLDPHERDPQQYLDQGAYVCLTRPFNPDELLQIIRQVLQAQHDSTESAPARTATPQNKNTSELLERRLIEQRTLSDLARSLSAVLNLDALLTQVVEAAVTLCSAEEGLLLLPDDEAKALYIRAGKGIDHETASNFRIKTQDTLAGQVFHSGQPILIGDQGWQKVKTEYLVQSLLYVPLSLKGKIIGVLGVNNRKTDRTFTEHDTGLLQDLAAHAAIAIENARLYEESLVRTRELITLVQASEAANSTLAIDRVLSAIAGQLIGALDVNQCFIGEWVPGQDHLDTLALCYRALWRQGAGPTLPLQRGSAVEQALSHQRPMLTTPGDSHPLAAWLPHLHNAQHIVYIPLSTQNQPIGMVALYHIRAPYPENNPPSTGRIQHIALEGVLRLTSSPPEHQQQHLFRTAQQLLDISGADWCDLALWNAGRQQLDVLLSYGEAIWPEAPKPMLPLDRFPQISHTLAEQAPFTGASAPDELCYLVETAYGQSFLGVPLIIRGQIGGIVILIDTLRQRAFERRQVELAQALISQAANALANARLYRDLEISLEELHRTQAKLVQTARLTAMGELAAAVAHQINNPLTTILGDTELILQDLPQEDLNYEGLEAISRAGRRAHEVVRRLLAMARQNSPDDVAYEVLEINESVENTLTLVKSHVQQGNVSLTIRLADNLPPILGIRGELEDVWLNLLLNARDAVANRPNPKIGIATRYNAAEDVIEAAVWDNGVGIPEEMLPNVFAPFFTTKPVGEGTGLGLHICHQIIEKCKGSIRVQSVYNEGTRFVVYLPVYHGQDTS